jgi:hypothetical protein
VVPEHYCDNDSYDEISLSVITNKAGASSFDPLTLFGQARAKSFWGYVLKLPVNTAPARVRGVVGYNLPKWLTGIRFRDNDDTITVEIDDDATGNLRPCGRAPAQPRVRHGRGTQAFSP